MAKSGMKRPDSKESNSIENHKTNISQNRLTSVTEIQNEVKTEDKKEK